MFAVWNPHKLILWQSDRNVMKDKASISEKKSRRELTDLGRVKRPPARKERVGGGESGTVEGGEQSADYGDLFMDRIGEERRGTDDRWNDGKEDLVSNRAGFDETVQLCAQRKELREVGGVRG
ncbi:hypothetical protein SLEP1_g40448 [Rubroshorea leprosula]|uniref:Uncharacterized protein n=1 Tax=Rubroshorea leprosula TaxID=152421 RepID=A0AAV5L3F3_9ROSI|nr:hypothetical protein SLEP1_g40448 [Rubroshorea leprosula]